MDRHFGTFAKFGKSCYAFFADFANLPKGFMCEIKLTCVQCKKEMGNGHKCIRVDITREKTRLGLLRAENLRYEAILTKIGKNKVVK